MPNVKTWIKLGVLTTGLCSLLPLSASASSFQLFNGLNYNNPANLPLLIQNAQLMVGEDLSMPRIGFKGHVTVLNPVPIVMPRSITTTGTASDDKMYQLPYGRIAARLSPQWVTSLDITKPFDVDIQYHSNSIVRYAITKFQIQSTDIAPNIAYQFQGALSPLSLGIGLDALYFAANVSQMFPSLHRAGGHPFGSRADACFSNHLSNWTGGWHGGILYHPLQGTFVGLSYFSDMNPRLRGKSNYTGDVGFPGGPYQGVTHSNNASTIFRLPATVNLNLAQMFTQNWLSTIKIYRTNWSRLERISLNHMAGPATSASGDFHYRNTWRLGFENRYQATSDLAVSASLAYDQAAAANSTDRTLVAPTANIIGLGLTSEYHLTKSLLVQTNYYHQFAKNMYGNHVSSKGTISNGYSRIYADAVGLRLTLNV